MRNPYRKQTNKKHENAPPPPNGDKAVVTGRGRVRGVPAASAAAGTAAAAAAAAAAAGGDEVGEEGVCWRCRGLEAQGARGADRWFFGGGRGEVAVRERDFGYGFDVADVCGVECYRAVSPCPCR